MRKLYYRCELTPLAPLALSGGDNQNTDRDALLDSRGRPFIPGSSVAGVLRTLLPADDADKLFGCRLAATGKLTESRVTVYDAVLPDKATFRRYKRDGVRLDEHKNAVPGAKFDFEIIETEAPFSFVLELDAEPDEEELADRLAEQIVSQNLAFGGKTTRGYGLMKTSMRKKIYDLESKKVLKRWLAFDPTAEDAFANALAVEPKQEQSILLRAEIEFCGSLLVRQYSTDVGRADYAPLRRMDQKPVIPGTSWAGMFRHRMLMLAKDAGVSFESTALFGSAGKADDGKTDMPIAKSRLSFSETTIDGGMDIIRTRTAIERFTGGAAKSKLYTSVMHQGGHGVLELRLSRSKPLTQPEGQLLAAVLLDLDNGLANVGGEGGIGRGLVRMKKLTANGVDVIERLRKLDLTIFEGGVA